ncbi:MAG: BON domain-containing protein [Bryobacteraceae bacterium]
MALSLACSNSSRETAREKARKLTQEAKQEAKSLDHKIAQGINAAGPVQQNGTSEAEAKLRHGGQELRAAGGHAAVKLDHAAMIAKVKAKLVSDVGLSAATSIDVDTNGGVVTLRGTVSTADQKQQAEQAVLQVNGVAKVINELRVQP